jgi:putative ABC transport system permease protein
MVVWAGESVVWDFVFVGMLGTIHSPQANVNSLATVVPTEAWLGGIAASLVIGALAGLIPALRAARLSPTQALWSV